MTGSLIDPTRDGMNVTTRKFKGWRLPDPGTAPDLSKVRYGELINLFNGRALSGWNLIDKNQTNGFIIENGVLINDPVQPEG